MLRNIALFYYDVLSFECLECAPIYHLVFDLFVIDACDKIYQKLRKLQVHDSCFMTCDVIIYHLSLHLFFCLVRLGEKNRKTT